MDYKTEMKTKVEIQMISQQVKSDLGMIHYWIYKMHLLKT